MRRPLVAGCAAVAAALLSGCVNLMPPYQRPAAPVPSGWPVGDAYLQQTEAALPALDLRQVFQDPKLRQLMAQALANNRDLAVAAANVASARALVRVERSALFPRVDAGAGATLARAGGRGADDRYQADIGISAFELDLFGRVRSLTAAARAEYFGTEAAARATRLTLLAEIARVHLLHASDTSLLRIARATQANAERSVFLTRARLSGGIAPRSDLRQAETILLGAQADIARLTTAIAQDVNALQLLVGAPIDPGLLAPSLEEAESRLGEVPAGLDSAILLRRPDVVQAEYTLQAANARIGAARAAFFPSISLTGTAGVASGSLASLFSGGAFVFNTGPSIRLPIFDGGLNRANLDVAQADRDAAQAAYERTIQTAFREVADALARRGTIDREVATLQQRVAAAEDSYFLADRAYRGGIGSFLSSLDAQRTLYEAQQQLVAARLARGENLVALYRVLGGDAATGAALLSCDSVSSSVFR